MRVCTRNFILTRYLVYLLRGAFPYAAYSDFAGLRLD